MANLDIHTLFNYTRDNGERQVVHEDPALRGNDVQQNISLDNILVRNARGLSMTLEKNGFELVNQNSSLSYKDFVANKDKVTDVYYQEIAEFVKEKTGASHVVSFHHLVRSSGKGSKNVPAAVAHADYTVRNSIKLFDQTASEEHRKGRFMVINAWRNINGDRAITNNHLAVCDATSVTSPDDFVSIAVVNVDGTKADSYHLEPTYYHRHRWFYYPHMKKSELLLFIQYDSDPISSCRYTFHSAIKDPNANPADIRESIEIRAIAFFPDYKVNTIPQLTFTEDDVIQSTYDKIMSALNFPKEWDKDGRAWMRYTVHKENGVEEVIQGLVDDTIEKGTFGMKGATKDQKDEVIKMLKASEFGTIAKKSFPKPWYY